MKPTNRLVFKTLESDLVYPLDKGYLYIAQLDAKWMEFKLRCLGAEDINNKYCVTIEVNNGTHILVTNHDGKYWLTVPLHIEEPDFDWMADVANGR